MGGYADFEGIIADGINPKTVAKCDKADKLKFKAYPLGTFHIDIAELRTKAKVEYFSITCTNGRLRKKPPERRNQ